MFQGKTVKNLRYFFLFNDMLVVCKYASSSGRYGKIHNFIDNSLIAVMMPFVYYNSLIAVMMPFVYYNSLIAVMMPFVY